MEVLVDSELIQFHPNTLEAVRKTYNVDKPGILKDAIDILDEWVQKQNHFLKKDFDRAYLERVIISSKGSVERAKARLDKLCTLRTMMPHFFEDLDVKKDLHHHGITSHILLPKLTKDNDRIFLAKAIGEKFSSAIYLQGFKYCVMMMEYAKQHDYADGYHIVLDYTQCDMMSLLTSANVTEMHQLTIIMMEGYGIRVKGIHLITSSKFVDALVLLIKQVVSEKIAQRIMVHKTLDSLFELLPKDIFPKEFGGEEKTFNEIQDNVTNMLSSQKFREHWRASCKARTNESCRQTDKFNDQYMGMPGTFRTLSVD